MNNIIKENYNIDVIGIIKISNKVYRIKSKDQKYYCFKYIECDNESVFAHLAILELNSFTLPLKNKKGSYLTKVDQECFYLLNWYEDEMVLAKEIRLKFFLEELIKLHKLSSYDIKINKGYFEDIFIKLEKNIDDELNNLNIYLSKIEKLEYKSPSEWLFLMNNNRFFETINKAKEHLNNFKKEIESLDKIRVSLNYLNFEFSNIFVKEKKILGIEKMKIAPIIFDIEDLFEKSYNYSIDIIMYLKNYLNEIKFYSYEKEWLLTLLFIPLINYSSETEIEKIIDISRINYHIERTKEVEKILTNN